MYPNLYLISVLKFIKKVKVMPNLELLVVLFIMESQKDLCLQHACKPQTYKSSLDFVLGRKLNQYSCIFHQSLAQSNLDCAKDR